jgi:hypothetical protein
VRYDENSDYQIEHLRLVLVTQGKTHESQILVFRTSLSIQECQQKALGDDLKLSLLCGDGHFEYEEYDCDYRFYFFLEELRMV